MADLGGSGLDRSRVSLDRRHGVAGAAAARAPGSAWASSTSCAPTSSPIRAKCSTCRPTAKVAQPPAGGFRNRARQHRGREGAGPAPAKSAPRWSCAPKARLSRLEQATAENIGLERIISELKVVTAGEQERAAELSTQLAAARAESRLASETMREQSELNRAEIKDLRAKLEEAGSRTKRVQKLHNELSAGQAATLDEKSKMQRDLASVQAENRQMAQRVEVLDNWLADWRRRFGDVDAARLAAVDRSEQLQVALAQSEALAKGGRKPWPIRRATSWSRPSRAKEAEQSRMQAEIAELKSLVSQGRAEIKMIRTTLAVKA